MSDLTEHAKLLYETLGDFMSKRTVEIGSVCVLGLGLMPERRYPEGQVVQPRMVVVSGLARIVDDPPVSVVGSDTFGIGFLQKNPPDNTYSHMGISHPEAAYDVSRAGIPPEHLDDARIIRFGRAIRTAEQVQPPADEAEILYEALVGRILTNLSSGKM